MQNISLRNFISNFGYCFNVHNVKDKPNVLIFSLPRSGSTWLQELIWSQPKFKYINEPLNLKGEWLQRKSKITGFNELYSNDVKEKLIGYFKGFVTGKNHFLNPNPFRKNSRLFTSRIVFKVIHGGELFIEDIANSTNSKIVYLIRNPIAVALSRKQITRTKELTSEFVLSNFKLHEKKYAIEIINNGTDMEKKIMLWCLQNKLALQKQNSNWLIISYENLILNPFEMLNKLSIHCDLPDINKMINVVNTPSAVTTQSETDSVSIMKKHSQRNILINKWRDKVSNTDKKRFFEICKRMGFGIYSDDSDLPDFSYIY